VVSQPSRWVQSLELGSLSHPRGNTSTLLLLSAPTPQPPPQKPTPKPQQTHQPSPQTPPPPPTLHPNPPHLYTGMMISSGTAGPRLFMRSYSVCAALSISSWPVRKSRMSPSGSDRWIWGGGWGGVGVGVGVGVGLGGWAMGVGEVW